MLIKLNHHYSRYIFGLENLAYMMTYTKRINSWRLVLEIIKYKIIQSEFVTQWNRKHIIKNLYIQFTPKLVLFPSLSLLNKHYVLLVQLSWSVVSDSLQPHESQHARPPGPSPILEFTQTHVHRVGDAIQPSHSLSSPSPAPNPSQHQSLFQWVNSSHEVAKVLEFQL